MEGEESREMRREFGIGEGASGAGVVSPSFPLLPSDAGSSKVGRKGGKDERREWILRARGSGSGLTVGVSSAATSCPDAIVVWGTSTSGIEGRPSPFGAVGVDDSDSTRSSATGMGAASTSRPFFAPFFASFPMINRPNALDFAHVSETTGAAFSSSVSDGGTSEAGESRVGEETEVCLVLNERRRVI